MGEAIQAIQKFNKPTIKWELIVANNVITETTMSTD